MRVLLYLLICFSTSGLSLYVDWGSDSFTWFQRSGTFIVLAGAILSYRSMLKLGPSGVGGLQASVIEIGKVQESYVSDDGRSMVKYERSKESMDHEYQVAVDKLAGYLGAIMAVLGTAICGYGDLLGKI